MAIEQNYFILFELPQQYQVDTALLSDRYRALQKTLHPDRYAHKSEREQLQAVQASAHLNEALATLKSPLRRAAYLLSLKGVDTDSSHQTVSDGAFLMQQMMLREQLDDARDAADPFDALEELLHQLQGSEAELQGALESQLQSDDPAVLGEALDNLQKLQFFDKLRHEIERVEDELDDL
ncbi:Fe-S protein assembly co-chaperone HscB [Motiliproteus sp.]|uniref:Fe-S protein assembly co-chaperone HscB n=1 Tax=Motiliproteus sp. TaxID=1898955 RepID=UPI003BA8E39B